MTVLWVAPSITHRMAIALRFNDLFTGRPVADRLRVRLVGWDGWEPVFGAGDSTYRFLWTNEAIPAVGAVGVDVESIDVPARYVDVSPLNVVVPPPGPAPTPLTFDHFRTDHPLQPTRAFRPPLGETAVRGVVTQGGVAQSGFGVAIELGAPPTAATPVVVTDSDGEFVVRLPAATAVVVPPTITTTAQIFATVTDVGGTTQPIASPPIPHVIDIGVTTSLSLAI